MVKRGKLEIIKDMLSLIQANHNLIKPTPLSRKSNLSTARFGEYLEELAEKKFVKVINLKKTKVISLTDKGFKFLEKYRTIVSFIEEFEL